MNIQWLGNSWIIFFVRDCVTKSGRTLGFGAGCQLREQPYRNACTCRAFYWKESWEWSSVSFQSGPSAGGGLPLAQKTLCNFYNNSIKQTRKSRLFSLIDWLVSLWNLPALPLLHTPCWGYRFTVLYPAFPWGLGSELSSHFLHSTLSTRRAVSPSPPDARSNQLYFHWRRLHVTLP